MLFATALLVPCCGGTEIPVVPVDPGGGDGGGDGTGDGVPDDGGDGTSDEPDGQGTVPGQETPSGHGVPVDGGGAAGGGTSGDVDVEVTVPLETVPPEDDDQPFVLPDRLGWILIALVVLGVVSSYAPGEIQRIRIESAHRESMDARLALAMGDFPTALAAFDRAIEQAHSAYTRRLKVGGPATWRLLPDGFYISLWRGRAAALVGMGRRRTAVATSRLADELEAAIDGHR